MGKRERDIFTTWILSCVSGKSRWRAEAKKSLPKRSKKQDSRHTHTHTPKDINPLPKNPTVTLRIHTHNPVECHVDTPDRKYNEIRR